MRAAGHTGRIEYAELSEKLEKKLLIEKRANTWQKWDCNQYITVIAPAA